MQTFKRSAALALAAVVAIAGCKGADGKDGANGSDGSNGSNGTGVTSGLHVAVTSVTTATTGPISVRFTLKDDRGFPVDAAGYYSVNMPMGFRFALAYVSTDVAGNVLPYTVLTKSGTTPQPTAFNPATAGQGTLVENGSGAGDYTYSFPTTTTAGGAQAVAYDATKLSNTHTVWIQATRQVDLDDTTNTRTFTAVDQEYDFIPAGGGTLVKREIVTTANCSNCHQKFRPETTVGSAFHSGGRVEAPFCNICHNIGRTSNPAADSAVFVHRIHNSEHLQPANLFHGIEATYPQDIRNCDACHGDPDGAGPLAAPVQGGQANARPTVEACGSCHDYVNFTATPVGTTCRSIAAGGVLLDAAGLPVPCDHIGGATTTGCAGCHSSTAIPGYHVAVAPPDPNASVTSTGTNNNTNAAWLAAANVVPTGATKFSYVVNSVSVDGSGHPVIVFKLQRTDAGVTTDVDFGTFDAVTKPELVDANFRGSPSVYFVWAVPEDGITAPADFNASSSGYIKNIWNGTATGTGAGTLAGPATVGTVTGLYTITLTGVTVPAGSAMFTGGVGFTYSLASAPPLTQISLAKYPYVAPGASGTINGTAVTVPLGKSIGYGGLIVPALDIWKVGDTFTGRRTIVANSKCNACHVSIGAAPTFHAGQRNDGPSCSWCHTPNRTSSGWSANAKDFIHSLHAGRIREVPFNWHATAPGEDFSGVGFPAALDTCQACHVAGAYDFSATSTLSALPNMLPSTVGQSRYNSDSVSNPNGWFSISPYVVSDNSVDYGYGFATSNVTATLPDGLSGTQLLADSSTKTCTVSSPCTCTAAEPCTQVVDGPYTVYNVAVTFSQATPAIPTCSVATPCTCVTNPATGPKTACTGTVATCSLAAPCDAQGTTLVVSPITAACSACHDDPAQRAHMESNGGTFYDTRSSYYGGTLVSPNVEQCLLCHGVGAIAPIGQVHKL